MNDLGTSNQSTKIYLDVVEKIRCMMEEDHLIPGDKLPSERELSERLNVGRSSVREALRSLELLGLIETRRGEGTFIKDFQEHKLVELLGTFFLQNSKVKEDLEETKVLIEIDCLRIIISTSSDETLRNLAAWTEQNEFDDEMFFKHISEINHNRLIGRIWSIVNTYSKAARTISERAKGDEYYSLVKALLERNEEEAIHIYLHKIRNMSKSV